MSYWFTYIWILCLSTQKQKDWLKANIKMIWKIKLCLSNTEKLTGRFQNCWDLLMMFEVKTSRKWIIKMIIKTKALDDRGISSGFRAIVQIETKGFNKNHSTWGTQCRMYIVCILVWQGTILFHYSRQPLLAMMYQVYEIT